MPHSHRNEALVFLGLIMRSLQEQGAVVDMVGPPLQGSFRPEYSSIYEQQLLCLGKKSFYFYEAHLQHPEKKKKVSEWS